ncbi:DNA-processing protein DprA [Oceanicola sp. 22II-s10i]|uniref:DNA-processing protein DprA n=1 Tax=Oceanicola sp. 22II-s10i TaxID=1317116 RepID=UPI000B52274B|nr:DNA-processing protein DprA [Oceanicola sp. 22II-s10i]
MVEDTHPSTHPPLPPTTEDGRLSWLRLLRSRRVGIATFYRLLTEHGSAAAALDALPDIAAAAGVPDYRPCPPEVAQAELRAAAQAGTRMICIGSPDYPDDLLTIPDPPPILWAHGDQTVLDRPRIAIVGARNASSLGTRMARALAEDLGAAGYVVVSGLARGIDAAAHHAALGTGTIGVMAGGVDMLYPAENAGLATDMAATGLRLSEQPMGLQPVARHFPLRNRLISGLARGVVVVEAAARSGSLITARTALDQGREVLAVPGHPLDGRSAGCNMLLRDGARLVRNAADVIEAIGLPAAEPDRQAALDLGPAVPIPPAQPETRTLRETAALHRRILDRLSPSPVAEDQLIRDLGGTPRQLSPAILDLEISGDVERHPGGLIALRPPARPS